MKLADFIADFIYKVGTDKVFCITGGAVMHLIDSVSKHPDLKYVCNLHEQATAMAADGYAKASGKLGVAMATSGPGATNLLTGCCSAYYESTPVMFFTGQVSVSRLKDDLAIRQFGFQETDVVSIFKPVTKYATIIKDASRIQYELEKAYYYAMNGRKGPVLIDVPDEIQRVDINVEELEHFIPPKEENSEFDSNYSEIIESLKLSKKPVLLVGQGVRLADAEADFLEFIEKTGLPVVHTWGAMDIHEYNHPLHFGSFGAYGTLYGKYAVAHADLILAVGTRFTTKQIGTPMSNFAKDIKKIIVDIDAGELDKFVQRDMKVDQLICQDAGIFLKEMNQIIDNSSREQYAEWISELNAQKQEHPVRKENYEKDTITDPHYLFDELSNLVPSDTIYVGDTGSALIWMMQALKIHQGQRCFSSFNNSPMGYALPAAIGASEACPNRMILCATGDGGFQMNIQELATLKQYGSNVKVIVVDNQGYGNIRLGINCFLNGHMAAVDAQTGVAVPDYAEISKAYGIPTYKIHTNGEVISVLKEFLQEEKAALCVVKVPLTQGNDL